MKFEWVSGYIPPKEITPEQAARIIEATPDPDSLFEASKKSTHKLHKALWSEGDQVWANEARREFCRKFIGSLKRTEIKGGKEISFRVVEFVRTNGEGRYATMDQILDNKDLLDGYFREIQQLQRQALNKMETLQILLKEKNSQG